MSVLNPCAADEGIGRALTLLTGIQDLSQETSGIKGNVVDEIVWMMCDCLYSWTHPAEINSNGTKVNMDRRSDFSTAREEDLSLKITGNH